VVRRNRATNSAARSGMGRQGKHRTLWDEGSKLWKGKCPLVSAEGWEGEVKGGGAILCCARLFERGGEVGALVGELKLHRGHAKGS